MKHIDHAAAMAAQDPAFPEYDEETGWPTCFVGAAMNVHEDIVRLRELAAATASPGTREAITRIADSFENGVLSMDRYMLAVFGPAIPDPDAHATLRELVALKDLHDAIEAIEAEGTHNFINGTPLPFAKDEYAKRKAIAWDAARKLLGIGCVQRPIVASVEAMLEGTTDA